MYTYNDNMDPLRELFTARLDIANIEPVRHEPFADGIPLEPTFVIHVENMTNPEVIGIRIEVSQNELQHLGNLGALEPRYDLVAIRDIIREAYNR